MNLPMKSHRPTKNLTEKQSKLLELYFNKPSGDLLEMGQEAGYKVNCRAQVLQIMEGLRDEINERIRTFLAIHGFEAAQELVGLMRDPSTPGAHIKRQVINDIFDRADMVKRNQIDVNHEGEVQHVFILPPKDIVDIEDIEYEVIHRDAE